MKSYALKCTLLHQISFSTSVDSVLLFFLLLCWLSSNIFPSRTRTTNGWTWMDWIFSTFYQLYLGVIWGIHIWPSKREMVDRSTNKRKQQKKQQRNKRLKRQTNRQTDRRVCCLCARKLLLLCIFLYCCFLFLPSYFCFPISQFTDVCMDGCVCVCVWDCVVACFCAVRIELF